MARIETIEYKDSAGHLKAVYDDLVQKRGKLAEVMKVQSLHPDVIVSHATLYLDIMFSRSPLSRAEREMIAVVVSVANNCLYCYTHHGEALNIYWKDEDRLNKLKNDFTTASLSSKENAMCSYAVHLTRHPSDHASNDFTGQLKIVGIDDRSILDLTLVTAYFNFVNRLVLGLGVQLEKEGGSGYKY